MVGIEGLLTVAGAQKQFKSIPVTDQSRMHASVTLSTIYEDLVNDKQRDKFKDKCANFLKCVVCLNCFKTKNYGFPAEVMNQCCTVKYTDGV